MFKKIQKYLLINHPLLWNTKVVPAIVLALVFHLLFFTIGYFTGAIDFTKENYYQSGFDSSVIVFFSILVTILFFVLWFVYYFRNNAHKSFYKQGKTALYKEWLIILLVSFLNVTYSISYVTGKTIRERSYFSKEEVRKRGEIIQMASVFINGSFQTDDMTKEITFNKERYSVNSLMNKSLDNFFYQPNLQLEVRIKKWMQQNNQAAVKKLMADYSAIAKEHHLKSNIDAQKWFELTYHYPEFTKYENIGRTEAEKSWGNFNNNSEAMVTAEEPVYKYYVPQAALLSAYSLMSRSWNTPIIEDGLFTVMLYLSLSLAMFIFSFRVTSGRNWLIALVSAGVLFIVTGILSTISGSGTAFLVFWLLIILAIHTYFLLIVFNRKGKKISGILLNLILWSLSSVLPILFALLKDFYNRPTYIDNADGTKKYINTAEYYWFEAYEISFSWINILIVIAVMLLFSLKIKQWKGIAES